MSAVMWVRNGRAAVCPLHTTILPKAPALHDSLRRRVRKVATKRLLSDNLCTWLVGRKKKMKPSKWLLGGQKMATGVGTWTEMFNKFNKNMFYYTDGTGALSPYESRRLVQLYWPTILKTWLRLPLQLHVDVNGMNKLLWWWVDLHCKVR